MADETKGHQQTSGRVEFCRVPNCTTTDYGKVRRAVSWQSEAHHILCIAQINGAISLASPELKEIIDHSKWCINEDPNMVALPIWGTTIMFYCAGFASIARAAGAAGILKGIEGNLKSSKTDAPPFENLPQHNYGHSGEDRDSSYNLEIKERLDKMIADLMVDAAEHSVTGDDIHTDLNTMSKTMRGELDTRGHRPGSANGDGTHLAWLHPATNWYEPFSMALVPKPMPFAKLTQKIIRVAQVLWRTS